MYFKLRPSSSEIVIGEFRTIYLFSLVQALRSLTEADVCGQRRGTGTLE